jgi:hypothetical protein
MKSVLVYQLGYDSSSDQEYLVPTGLFVVHNDDPEFIKATANQQWGNDWFGLAYQYWDNNDLDTEKKSIWNKK